LNAAKAYEIVSATWLRDRFAEPNWLNHPYRWGPEGAETKLSSADVDRILKSGLGFPSSVTKHLGGLIDPLLAKCGKDDLNGPHGPKTKSTWTGGYGT
jgi:hypothetical protein